MTNIHRCTWMYSATHTYTHTHIPTHYIFCLFLWNSSIECGAFFIRNPEIVDLHTGLLTCTDVPCLRVSVGVVGVFARCFSIIIFSYKPKAWLCQLHTAKILVKSSSSKLVKTVNGKRWVLHYAVNTICYTHYLPPYSWFITCAFYDLFSLSLSLSKCTCVSIYIYIYWMAFASYYARDLLKISWRGMIDFFLLSLSLTFSPFLSCLTFF